MMRSAVAMLVLATFAASALAADTIGRLGDASVRFDRTRWKASVSETSIRFEPQGDSGRKLDPVDLRTLADDAPCTVLAERAFAIGLYDTSEIARTPAAVGGVTGQRFAAHTGCRNATPRGEIICVRVAGRAYLLQALQPGCGGRNLFSGIDPLAEIAEGITFQSAQPSAP